VKGFTAALPVALLLSSLALAAAPALAVDAADPAGAANAANAAGAENTPAASAAEASYQFALAKMLATEGDLSASLAAFEKAEKLVPDSPYVWLEHAEALSRLSQAAREAATRDDLIRRAAIAVSTARKLAPENLDVLRAMGRIYIDLSALDPLAMVTAKQALEAVRQRDPEDPQAAIVLGQIYLEEKQPDKAAEVLRDLVTRLPQQRMAYALLVEALLRADKPQEAEKVLGDIVGFDPGSLEARLTLVDLQSKRGDHTAAVETLQSVPEELRAEPRVQRQLAWELYRQGDLDGAIRAADAVLANPAIDPSDRGLPSLVKGLSLAAEGEHEQALALLRPLADQQPGNVPLLTTVARVLEREGKRDEAGRLLADLADRLAKDGKPEEEREVRLELAQDWFDAKRWDDVAQAVAPLLAVDDTPVRVQAVLLQADALVEAGHADQALAALDKAGPSASVRARRADVLMRSGREEEGRKLLAEMSASSDSAAVLAAAQTLQRRERYQDSIPLLEKLVGKEPKLAAAGFLLGAAYDRTGQHDLAVKELRRVLAVEPDFHAALNYLGYSYAEAGENLDEALSLSRRAVALEPDNGAYVDSLGWTYYRLGQPDQARGYLERAARLEPTDATLQEHLGDVYVALGQTERAREAYRRALELRDSNADQVRQKLEKLPPGGPSSR
jgi:tetratricopeptide (TPR) repeat protein